jgi:hypothetical protein
MTVGQMGGEVIGAEHAEHTVRFVAQRAFDTHRAFNAPLCRAIRIGFD